MEIDPKIKLFVKEEVDKAREHSDRSYAVKLVEKAVFYTAGMFAIAVLSALIKLVII